MHSCIYCHMTGTLARTHCHLDNTKGLLPDASCDVIILFKHQGKKVVWLTDSFPMYRDLKRHMADSRNVLTSMLQASSHCNHAIVLPMLLEAGKGQPHTGKDASHTSSPGVQNDRISSEKTLTASMQQMHHFTLKSVSDLLPADSGLAGFGFWVTCSSNRRRQL